MEERKIKVRDWNVHYAISGHGPKYVTCISGGFAFGMIFKAVLEGFDPDKFTIIAWDTPGFAKSRPPHRVLDENLFEDDAVYAYEFMMALKIPSYSVLGFCGGGRAAMIMAAQYPDQVESIILINSSSFVYPHEWEWTVNADVTIWNEKMRNKIMHYCGEDYATVWASLCAALADLNKRRKGVIISDEILQSIKCNTLIMSGAKDRITDPSHVNYLKSKIKNSWTYVNPEGGHFMHINLPEVTNEEMQQFLLK